MFSQIKANFLKRADFSDEELELICSKLEIRKVKRKKSILSEGNIPNFIIYINSGLTRMFTVDDELNEQTFDFACEDQWMADLDAFRENRPSNVNIEAVEDCELFQIQFEDVIRLHEKIPRLMQFSRLHAEEKYIEAMKRLQKINHPTFSAEERYLQFEKHYAHIVHRLPSLFLASFLGIASETLSRIRRSISNEKRS